MKAGPFWKRRRERAESCGLPLNLKPFVFPWRLCHSSWTTSKLTALERALTGERWWCTHARTTAVGEMNTWKSSYGNKTSLQALFNFHQVTKLSHLNRTLALFQCISALCKQVIELKTLVTASCNSCRTTKSRLWQALFCAPQELLLQPGNEARCICSVNFTSNLNSECLNKNEVFLDWWKYLLLVPEHQELRLLSVRIFFVLLKN